MARGISIHVGLNEVDARHYGSPLSLTGCLGDVESMHALAVERGFEPRVIQGTEATTGAVLAAVRQAAAEMVSGDILMLTYSGHGARVPDINLDEGNGWDETWCLYDRELIDDELCDCWADFAAGTRILVVSDSCFSGDMIRDDEDPDALPAVQETPSMWGTVAPVDEIRRALVALAGEGRSFRLTEGELKRMGGALRRGLNHRAAQRVYSKSYDRYNQIQLALPNPRRPVHADVLLLSAAQDNETACDGANNGAFTEMLMRVWNGGAFQGSYIQLHAELLMRLRSLQHPHLAWLRPTAFMHQRPFTI